jgi:hypothetical protein
MAVSLSPICGSTRRGLGVAPSEREEDLREGSVQAQARTTEAYRGAPGVELPWESFRDLDKALRALPRDLPADLQALEIGEVPVLVRIFHNVLYSKAFFIPL